MTIEPTHDYLKNNQTLNQPEAEKLSKYRGNKCGDLTSIQIANPKLEIKPRVNAVGKVKLKPLKNKSAVIDVKKTKECLNKKMNRNNSNDQSTLGNCPLLNIRLVFSSFPHRFI